MRLLLRGYVLPCALQVLLNKVKTLLILGNKNQNMLQATGLTCALSFGAQGLKAVREGDGATVADEGVQRLIRRRVEVYPDKAARDMHRARCVASCE